MSSKNFINSDPDFCARCGGVLPLPGNEDVVVCSMCAYKVDVRKFDGLTIAYEIKFNNKGKYRRKKEKEKEERKSAALGPLVDRECSKCGNQNMTYATLQTRSADEGQTVFYSCPNCQHQEHENS
ncbi:DNA-directed RNA polymerase I subunit RPA12-like [Stegodyphus dumicola]|uniref:DNA-directed RNA polymerase I subunit RPA12-like n=1 Tax=Stegodyphus dumicola TaxID=202533 RepID=UPI0015A99092|nr:DNA-directed RNA polymerase I subunit RPA12-like [Stegodyphus dumicola]